MQDRDPIPLARDGIHEKVIEYLRDKPRGRILDIPTGFGALAKKLFEMNFAVSCCDIDTDQFLVEGLKIDRGDLNGKIPYADNAFDYVCFLEAIEHTENPYNAVREIARVLKPGGTLIMSTPNYLNIERRLKFLVTGFFTKPVPQQMFHERFHGQKYAMHLSPIGYTLVRFMLECAGFAYYRNDLRQKENETTLPQTACVAHSPLRSLLVERKEGAILAFGNAR